MCKMIIYSVEYVTCKTCKSPDTILTKENRIFFQQCESCGSTRSVSAIKSGTLHTYIIIVFMNDGIL